jgi:hypothetical protein
MRLSTLNAEMAYAGLVSLRGTRLHMSPWAYLAAGGRFITLER